MQHWARGGPTTLANLVFLCRRHHRLVHEGGWYVDRRGRFHDSSGRPFPSVPGLPRGQPDRLLARQHGLGIASQTYQTSDGDPAELRDLVDARLTITNRSGS